MCPATQRRSSLTSHSPSRSTLMVRVAALCIFLCTDSICVVATKTPQQTPPLLGRGALCADSMGLVSISHRLVEWAVLTDSQQGKTLTMLALVLATKSDVPPDFSNTTLIGAFVLFRSSARHTLQSCIQPVVPLSILSNWEKQIEDHVQPGALTSCVYYGATRAMTTEDLKKYDVVITTYQTVTNEHADAAATSAGDDGSTKKKRKTQGSLFQVSWKVSW